MYTYYIVAEYSEDVFGGQTLEGATVELSQPLTTASGVGEAINWIRQEHKDAVLLWWTLLEGEDGDGQH
jgi:hypothetical protein